MKWSDSKPSKTSDHQREAFTPHAAISALTTCATPPRMAVKPEGQMADGRPASSHMRNHPRDTPGQDAGEPAPERTDHRMGRPKIVTGTGASYDTLGGPDHEPLVVTADVRLPIPTPPPPAGVATLHDDAHHGGSCKVAGGRSCSLRCISTRSVEMQRRCHKRPSYVS